MKTKKIKKKLDLRKSTVTNLNFTQLKSAKGGTQGPDTDRTCEYCDTWVSCEWTVCPICASVPDTVCCATDFTCGFCY